MTDWCKCGAPMRFERKPDGTPWVYRCRVCYLVGLTSIQVRALDEEERGQSLDGVAFSSIVRRVWIDGVGDRQALRQQCNDTESTWATAWWLPQGCGPLPQSWMVPTDRSTSAKTGRNDRESV